MSSLLLPSFVWNLLVKNLNSSSDLYKEEIKRAAFKYDLNPALIKAVIQAESNFDHLAISSVGAEGLMQLMLCGQ